MIQLLRINVVNDKIRTVSVIKDKKNRSEADEYVMCLAMEMARELDPKNADIKKLVAELKPVRVKLVKNYNSEGKAHLLSLKEDSSDDIKVKTYLAALSRYNNSLSIEPANFEAAIRKYTIYCELKSLINNRISSGNDDKKAGNFIKAEKQLAWINDINAKTEHKFDKAVDRFEYDLNLQWAASLLEADKPAQAEAKINKAITISHTSEAMNIRLQILNMRSIPNTEQGFEQGLAAADKLIAAGNLPGADSKIAVLSEIADTTARKNQLTRRLNKIKVAVGKLYKEGVQAFRNEDYGKAVDLFLAIITIDKNYKQAGDYLDKSRSKLKLLEQY